MENDLIYIVVLAWNHKEDTREALTSFLNSNYSNYRIVVVDNGSTDGTDSMVAYEFPSVELISVEKNLGVSGGYNLGIEHAISQNAKYIMISNNDVVVDSNMILCLLEAIKKDPYAGIAMPKIYHYYGNRKRIWCSGAYFRKFPPTVKMRDFNRIDNGQINSSLIEFAPSCVLLLKVDLIRKIGTFDTNFYFYFDDWDFSRRARDNNFKILFVAEAVVWHKVSTSTQKTEKPAVWWERMGWSAALYYSKYHTNLQRQLFYIWFFVREVLKGNLSHSLSFYKGVKDYSAHCKTVRKNN